MGKGWTGMQLWPKSEFRTRTPFVVTGGFWEGLNGSGSNRKTFRVSGHAHCVGRSGCGQQKIDAFGVVFRNIMIPFPLPPEDSVVKPIDELPGVLGEELQEDDEEMEEVEEIDNGGGVGAFLAPARKKMVKKTLLEKASAKNGIVKPETRSSVFAKAGVLSARELTRLAEECSVLAKQKEDEELAEGVPREVSLTIEENTQLSLSG